MTSVIYDAGECDFTTSHITEDELLCFLQSPYQVTYRARLNQTSQASIRQLTAIIQQWIESNSTIAIQGVHLRIDNCQCSVMCGPRNFIVIIVLFVFSVIANTIDMFLNIFIWVHMLAVHLQS